MNGLRLPNKLDFEQIISPIADLICNYYWLVDGTPIIYKAKDGSVFSEWEENYDKIILQTQDNNNVRLTEKGFLTKYAKFISGDWDDICGIEQPIDISGMKINFRMDKNFIYSNVKIYLSCIDAAFWLVYSPRYELLAKLKGQFPTAVPCLLKDKEI